MVVRDVDRYTREDIIEAIKSKAVTYVPEWRFDEKSPDAGTALALVYADMFSKTVKKFSRILDKNRITFLNELGAKLLPAIPATGYVSFDLVNDEVDSVELEAKTVVTAQSEDTDTGIVRFQTVEDVLVSPAKVNVIFHTYDVMDYISSPYVRDNSSTEEMGEIALFSHEYENLQKHEMYITHIDALRISGTSEIRLRFCMHDNLKCPEIELQNLCNMKTAVIEYYSDDGYICFDDASVVNGEICLKKSNAKPPLALMTLDGADSFALRVRVLDITPFDRFFFRTIHIGGSAKNIPSDSIYANGLEVTDEYFPFGENLALFNEVYFSSEETLCKKGARIELAFNVGYAIIPLDFNPEDDPIKWKWIMKSDAFKPNPDYDVTISEVLWEYYNGIGWARLYPDSENSDIFTPREVVFDERKTVSFACPSDIDTITVNSINSYFVRARITKIQNLYKMKGVYVAPVLTNTSWSYDYKGFYVAPQQIVTYNNLDENIEQTPAQAPIFPFKRSGLENNALYFGFDMPPIDGPLKFLFTMKENLDINTRKLTWELFNGKKWSELNLTDETQGFSRTGLVTMIGGTGEGRLSLFGTEKYWIRVVDSSVQTDTGTIPSLTGIYANTTKIINVDNISTEFFRMEIYQENSKFSLPENSIINAEVYINELSDLSDKELALLMADGKIDPAYDEAGVLTECWVRWDEVESLAGLDKSDRAYILDRNAGSIMFGNGRYGRIPSASGSDNIRVEYQSGGGQCTNVPEGAAISLERHVGFINNTYNPRALTGGCDIEPLQEAITRSSALIRHQSRAVTERDYEDIVKAASRSIARVKCLTGFDNHGIKAPGCVTIAVLLKDYINGRALFYSVKEDIEKYLSEKISGDLFGKARLFIVEPNYLEIEVRAMLNVSEFGNVFSVKKAVSERLDQFLDPFVGGFDSKGWEIGRIPGSTQIRNLITSVPGVKLVRNVFVSAHTGSGRSRREVDMDIAAQNRLSLPINGKHQVIIEVK